MSLQASVGFQIPTNVVEVGDEISTDQLAALNAASTPSAGNPLATQGWVSGQGYITSSSGITAEQAYALGLTAIVQTFVWAGGNYAGSIVCETPYLSANKGSYFKFRLNNSYDFTPSWSGTSFSLSSVSDDTTYTSTGSGESLTIVWNGGNAGIPVI